MHDAGIWKALQTNNVQLLKAQMKGMPLSSSYFMTSNRDVRYAGNEKYSRSLLSWACIHKASKCVKFLLARPEIDVNVRDGFVYKNTTPFMIACTSNELSVVRMFLADARVDTTLTSDGCSAMWRVIRFHDSSRCSNKHLEVCELFIASDRDLGSFTQRGEFLIYSGSILDMMALNEKDEPNRALMPEMKDLLDRLRNDFIQLRHELRLKHGFSEQDATDVFAMVIFLCDDLLKLNMQAVAPCGVPVFFRIACRLPMELQMLLCHRVYGSPKHSIPSHKSEPAFKALAQKKLVCL